MFHKVILVGNLGRDPEMRYTPGGQAVTNLSVATNRTCTDGSGNQVKQTVWFRVSVWGKQAESCHQYLRKGRPVLVEGRLNPDDNGAGDIVLQWPVPILPTDSLHDLRVRSREVGAQAVLEAIEQIEHGSVRRRSMDPSRATYFTFPKREDARRLRRMGRALL